MWTRLCLQAPAEADAGVLEICVGGRKADFDRLSPLFDTYCSKYTYIGESGSGHLVKLAINFVGGVYSACLAQAFPVMEKLGVPRINYTIFSTANRLPTACFDSTEKNTPSGIGIWTSR